MRSSLKGAVAVVVAAAAFVAPSAAQADTYKWANPQYIGGGVGLTDRYVWILAGVYCHELDGANTRFIQINATYSNGTLYGSWVQYQTDGYRSYAGNYALAGACRNPHTVGYYFNAHDNYYV